ncbi:hypothetical protein PENFLA_c020G01809 [Penicillium flavigenum]|uniref:Uncharacterized protein n=1 Tax=Penicillium flavigenum TaxID=254877 RepID=A0A1V6SYE8_9EURO|nr:hypothetical protein PENFLA_c020G01809 [Penicillium flavigenum]
MLRRSPRGRFAESSRTARSFAEAVRSSTDPVEPTLDLLQRFSRSTTTPNIAPATRSSPRPLGSNNEIDIGDVSLALVDLLAQGLRGNGFQQAGWVATRK